MQPTHTNHHTTPYETLRALDESQQAARLAHVTIANTANELLAPQLPDRPVSDKLFEECLDCISVIQELVPHVLHEAFLGAVAQADTPVGHEEPVDGDADDEFDPACNKRCTKCSNIKPFDEFAKKRGARAAICKACNRAYQHEHYKATADVRRPQLKARHKRIVAELNTLIDERRAVATCNNCGGDDKLTATSPHGAPSQLAKAEKRTELIKALDTAVWECRVCRMSAVGSSNVGHSRVPGAPLLDDAIVTAVRSGATTAATVTTAVQQVRATTIESVRQRMLELTAAQVLVRTSRGQYAVGPQAKP